jgi:ATP-dependent DNA helicase RecG
VILLGVEDDGSIVGRALTPGLEDSIHQAALAIYNPGRYWIREVDVEGRPVTVISVAARAQGFAQTTDGQVLVRRGASSGPLLGAELQHFITSRALERFDVTDTRVPLSKASDDLLAGLRNAFRWRAQKGLTERLAEHKLVVVNGTPTLTVAGALTLLADPAKRLGKTFIEILRFPDESVDYDRRVEIKGPVQEQVEAATRFVIDELGTDLIVSGVKRYELPKIPEVVLREAIANAVAHRTYEDVGRAVRIELRPDAVSIKSPGGLPEPVTEENIREAQSARNIHVLSVLRRLRLAEDTGRGVDVMQDSMAEALLDPPRFHDATHSVEVTLPIRGAISPQERAWILEVERRGELLPRDRIPLVHAARGEVLTNAKVRDLLGVDSRDARQSLQRLRDAGFLSQRGQRGGSAYTLARSVNAPAAFRMSKGALEDFVVEMAREEPITNSAVRAATGLDRVEALRILDRLVRSRRLRRYGARRGTYYLAPPQTDHANGRS